MRKLLAALCVALWVAAFASMAYAADTKISAMTADTSPTSDDLIPTVNDPAGTPANRKVTAANLITKAHGLTGENYLIKLNATAVMEATNSLTGLTFGGFTVSKGIESDASGNLVVSTLTGLIKGTSGAFSAATSNTDYLPPVGPILNNGSTGPGYIDFKEDSDNGTNYVRLIGPASTADVTITLPAATGTIALVKAEKLASFAWDGGGSAVATSGSKRCTCIPYAATITGYTMVIDQDPGAGGTILAMTKDAFSDTTLPTTDIDASAPPTVADNKVAANDETLTGWTKSVAANDIICAAVATNAVSTWISLTIYGTK